MPKDQDLMASIPTDGTDDFSHALQETTIYTNFTNEDSHRDDLKNIILDPLV